MHSKTATSNDVIDMAITVVVLESDGDKTVDKFRNTNKMIFIASACG